MKRALALAADAFVCAITVWMAFNLRLESWTAWSSAHFIAFVCSVAVALPLFTVFGLYRAIFRYAGLPALLTVLMLRGPQTAGELRLNCERLHKFADISSVEAFLEAATQLLSLQHSLPPDWLE
mgnify:CR=1 FL=1